MIGKFTVGQRAALLLLAVASGGLVVGCVGREEKTPRETPVRQSFEIEHLLLVSIDTCRADRLSCYDSARSTTPNIDKIADEGFLFTHAVSPVPLTLPAHSSMLTGRNPHSHGVHDNLSYQLDSRNRTLAEILGAHGFTTGAIVSAFVLDGRFGIGQGFDEYQDEFEAPPRELPLDERRAEKTTELAVDWLARHRSEKSFLFLHYFDPHELYDPPEPFSSRYADQPYEGEIAYTDHWLGKVFDALKQYDMYDSTLIIITSDHGEMLGEHGENNHSYFIYQGVLRVPLIFKIPGWGESRQISDLVGLVDIVPTVCSLLNINLSEDIQGTDLSSYFTRDDASAPFRYYYAESLTPTKYGAAALRGLVGSRWKLIHTVRPELYDLVADPNESLNLFAGRTKEADEMRLELEEKLEQSQPLADARTQLDEETLRRITSLGYVSGNISESAALDASGTDPKDMLEFYLADIDVDTLIRAERYDEALTLCEKMLRQRPDAYETRLKLARIAMIQGHLDVGLKWLHEALELEPDRFEVHDKLGAVTLMLGRPDEAIEHCEKALQRMPENPEVHSNLGSALAQLGRFDEAREHFQESLRLRPNQFLVHKNLARLYSDQGNDPQTIVHLTESLRLREDQPELWHRLGVAHARQGALSMSAKSWERALRLKPDWPLVLNHLARLRAAAKDSQLRDPSQAVEFAQRACELTKYEQPVILDTLSLAHASAGQFDEAVRVGQQAIQHARAIGQDALAEAIEERLKQYQPAQP